MKHANAPAPPDVPSSRLWIVAALLFTSGCTALVYQTVWLREFRGIFGYSTSATAAVLAAFMGGLGWGAAHFGPRADAHRRPLFFYAQLEGVVAIAAALSPILIAGAGLAYRLAGGSAQLGVPGGTLLRVALTAFILGIPAAAMGGSLAAAVRAGMRRDDAGRLNLAFLYGANTAGAVVGVFGATFFLIELLGNRATLWIAALANLAAAAAALLIDRSLPAQAVDPVAPDANPESRATRFVLPAAALTGFVFFLAEMIWYRMLSPLLGGSTFSFGLILTIALLGIGIGSFVQAAGRQRSATYVQFAFVTALQAVALLLPLALGDRLAVLAVLLRPLAVIGFSGSVTAWSIVTAIVVLPAAILSGIQFPMLVSLLGRGRPGVGGDLGRAYAWNTAGSLAGSLAGGFVVLPLLGAVGAWRLAGGLMALLAIATLLRAVASAPERRGLAVWGSAALVALTAAVFALVAPGPSAAWRHTPIGAGRADLRFESPNGIRAWLESRRRALVWEAEGRESSIALLAEESLAHVVNGKSDGNARLDAGTQVMGGLVGALVHGSPRNALVIGLGTGSSAGWLAAVPSIERVDVIELEPATVEVARRCAAVNHDAPGDPKVRLHIGDAREFLPTMRGSYDVIFSEPSNPFRSGVASLFTAEFYRDVRRRLNENGVFVQWLQAYEIDAATVRAVYATLSATFPNVATWQSQEGDLLLVGTAGDGSLDLGRLRSNVASDGYRDALANVWRVTDAEGVLARFIAGDATARAIGDGAPLNRDDRNVIEFGIARRLGESSSFDTRAIREVARTLGDENPRVLGPVDWSAVGRLRISAINAHGGWPLLDSTLDDAQRRVADAHALYARGSLAAAVSAWKGSGLAPRDLSDLILLAEGLADEGNPGAEPLIAELARFDATEAEFLLARLRWREGKTEEAVERLVRAFESYRTNPWPPPAFASRSLEFAVDVAQARPEVATRLFAAIEQEFAVALLRESRLRAMLALAEAAEGGCGPLAMRALDAFGEHLPWEHAILRLAATCRERAGDPRAGDAARALESFERGVPEQLNAPRKQ